MAKILSILLGFLLIFPATPAQDKKDAPVQTPPAAEWKVPPEEAQRANPVRPSNASIAEGKNLYRTQCAMCHGTEGDGKGDLAVELKMKLRDYRDAAALKGVSDGELHYMLLKGKGQMPGQEGRMREAQLWNLVNFIRSLARTEPPTKAPEK